jgi:hypothetical protein
MTPKYLHDYAVNIGEFYATHCTMARQDASPIVWVLHLTSRVLPRYRREHHEPYEGMSRVDCEECAAELRAYYKAHIDEC